VPFYMQNPSTRKETFGGVQIPSDPFVAAAPLPGGWGQAVVGDVADGVVARAGIAQGPAGEIRAERIGRVIMAAQEEIVPDDRTLSATRLAAIHWGVQRALNAPRQDRLATQVGLMEVARRNGLDAEFSEAVRLMGARAALEEARRPKEKGLVEAAARGEKEAREVLMDRQPALYGAVISAAEGGAGEGFWSRLVAQAEARLVRVEAEAAKGRADRLQRTTWDSDVRRDLEALVAATAAGEGVEPGIRRLARRNADLARVAGDLLTGTPEDIARRSPALLAGMSGPIGREVRRLRVLAGQGETATERA
jgi:hypothetical protein